MTITYTVKNALYLNITNRCPCDCVFCLRKNGDGVYGSKSLWLEREPSLNEIFSAIESCNLDDYSEVVFCGYGEPTERLDDMLQVAKHIKNLRPHMPIRLNTNGLGDLINAQSIAPKFKALIDVVSISLNTPDPMEYVTMCRPSFGECSHKALIDFAKACTEYVPEVVLSIVGSPITTPKVQERCKEIATAIGAKLRIRPYES